MNKKKSASISVGWQGDIPVIPPVIALVLSLFGTILTWGLGRYEFLPTGSTIRVIRIIQFVFALAVSVKVNSLSRQELEAAKSGVRFTPVHGLAKMGEVYSRSRNPLYCILLLILVAWAVLVNSAWFLLSAMGMWMYLHYWVIPVEERFLKDRFGKEYEAYCATTSRWFTLADSR